ncbi:ABC-type Fe3+-siderophore transport system, permease component [Arthrobacter crystallopoietes BAB-32]|uniref:ABC-type Fe3+-siderophore transport system, permease component n=1 Tax=Arthrobacter crystallopoietes BAB-32 TaxID=1246476 RepID=N1UXS8_9MICC|nr:iron ABC transporter permease [Arthrobacter crystallopoietes]EMY33845.1 ABC-type Fe3+-siderophore transport system, permease component [Arthrobacter crystallopoietes BAB-32]
MNLRVDQLRSGQDPLGQARRRRQHLLVIVTLAAVLVAGMLVAVGSGPVTLGPGTVAEVLASHLPWQLPGVVPDATANAIVWEVRLPRVLLGSAVGAGLAVCGAALQAMVRNLLADPYLLGINSGASCGAASMILFGVGLGVGEHALSASAFAGALVASMMVFLVARAAGRVTSLRLLLAGVAIGYALTALTSFLIFASGSAEGARSVMFWLLGSLALAKWGSALAVVLLAVLLTAALLTLWGRRLDALAIGDETAHILGVPPARFRTQLLIVVSLCVGVVVAASGSIGFVGLVVPHLARRLVGAAHAWVIPVSALLGAIFLVWADLLARVLLQPQELPIGIITAFIGAPFLLHLIRQMRQAP